jgi:hypothetical protein
MAQFIIVYLGGNQPSSQEEGRKHYAKYKEWLVSLGNSVVSPANPFKNTHTIKPDGVVSDRSSTAMSGYTIIRAESIDEAITVAKACPFLEIGGSLEVSELIQM